MTAKGSPVEAVAGNHDQFAEVYDQWITTYDPACIEVLAAFAAGKRALELGIGTGRVALPLASTGCPVTGVDISTGMIAKLREKPGTESLSVVLGNFMDVDVEGYFSLVYIVCNTFGCLLTPDEQIRCFSNVRRKLADGGVFVIEMPMPDGWIQGSAGNLHPHQHADGVLMHLISSDPVRQLYRLHHLDFTAGRTQLYTQQLRFVWPSEFDLLAKMTGFRLQSRWGNWRKDPLTRNSTIQIAAYESAS